MDHPSSEDTPLTRRECDHCALKVEVDGMRELIKGVKQWISDLKKDTAAGIKTVDDKVEKWDGRMWKMAIGALGFVGAQIAFQYMTRPTEAAIAQAVLDAMRKGVHP